METFFEGCIGQLHNIFNGLHSAEKNCPDFFLNTIDEARRNIFGECIIEHEDLFQMLSFYGFFKTLTYPYILSRIDKSWIFAERNIHYIVEPSLKV